MAEESAPPPPGGEVETGKKKLRLKVTQVKENTPRVRRRVISAVPAAIPGCRRRKRSKPIESGQVVVKTHGKK